MDATKLHMGRLGAWWRRWSCRLSWYLLVPASLMFPFGPESGFWKVKSLNQVRKRRIHLKYNLLFNSSSREFFLPLGRFLKLSGSKSSAPTYNEQLEMEYQKSKQMKGRRCSSIAKKIELSEDYINSWWKQRQKSERPSPLSDFTECAWEASVYFSSFILGLVTLSKETYTINLKDCFRDIPNHVSWKKVLMCVAKIN